MNPIKKLLFSFIITVSACTAAKAQTVKQAYTIPYPGQSMTNQVRALTIFDNKLYYQFNDIAHGTELWVYDGIDTPRLLCDLGIPPHVSPFADNDQNMMVVNNTLYFAAILENGLEVYMLQKGSSMPTMVKDINPGATWSSPKDFMAIGNTLYFTANALNSGNQIWSMDATTNQPVMRTNMPAHLTPQANKTLYKNKIYFATAINNVGHELHAFDIATNAVTLIADLNGGTASSEPLNLFVHNNILYFSAETAQYGRELWSYDGVTLPKRLTDIYPGAPSGVFPGGGIGKYLGHTFKKSIMPYKGDIYLLGNDAVSHGLYKYEVATGITTKVGTFTDTTVSTDMTVFGNKLYFFAKDMNTGTELWQYDGVNPPKIASDFYPGPTSGIASPGYFAEYNYKLYFGHSNFMELSDEEYTGIKDKKTQQLTTVYPNPVTTTCTITLPSGADKVHIAVTNAAGQQVVKEDRQATGNTLQLEATKWAPGIYVYHITDEAGAILATGKLQKQ